MVDKHKSNYLVIFLVILITSCSSNISSENISINLEEDNLSFSTKALTESYYKKKLQKFISDSSGSKLIRDLELARYKGESVIPAKSMFKNDINFYNTINNNSYVIQEKAINNPFKIWLEGMLTYNITTIAGTGVGGYNGDNILATSTQLNYPYEMTIDKDNNIYIADTYGHRIRKLDVITGKISTIVGTGTAGYNGDNILAKNATVNGPSCLKIDENRNIYFSDMLNNRIRKVDANTGLISTIVGTGTAGYNGDNILATNAQINKPYGILIDKNDNIYFSDSSNHSIRKIYSNTGLISTIVGTGTAGYNGDNIQAINSQLNTPLGISFGSNKNTSTNIYIAERNGNRIRKVDLVTGLISTVAGTGTANYNGDNIIATNAQINHPHSVASDNSNNIYITDTYNQRIRKVNVSTGIISTIAGNGVQGYNGSNILATTSHFNYPIGIEIDKNNNIYISGNHTHVISKIY